MDTLPPLAVVGAGSMGGAIIRGLVAAGIDPARITVSTKSGASAAAWRHAGVRAYSLEEDPAANAAAVHGAGLVLIGVKPAMVPDALAGIADALDPVAIVVSVAAGVTTSTMEAVVSNPVIRAMPNTPALVRKAVTGIAAGSRAGAVPVEIARRLFETVGTVVEVPEDRIDALSAISGSGPATFAFLIEQLTAAAQRLGFDEADARVMAEHTFIGTAALLEASGDAPAELRRKVTSPKGTTERIIAVLEEADLGSVFDRAAAAAITRAEELARD
jgi:pyrroline-5-carboxylate reductase